MLSFRLVAAGAAPPLNDNREVPNPLRLSRRAADRLRAGHLWVYRSDLLADEAEQATLLPGALLTVEDPAGHPLGTALYSSASQLALRLVSRTPGLDRPQYLADLAKRVAEAVARRRHTAPLEVGTDAQRLLFAEADNTPGIVADRYANLVILQLLTQGTAQDDVRQTLVDALRTALAPNREPLTIIERPDPRIRELEQLPAPPAGPLFHSGPADEAPNAAPTATDFHLNGLQFHYDAAAGQKTGAFLDQRLNYAAAAGWVRRSGLHGHALDVCTYHGGFALHLAEVCRHVTGVDQSRAALEVADRNRAANPQLTAAVDWIEADAFDLLRALDDAARPAPKPGTLQPGTLQPGTPQPGSLRPAQASKRPTGLPTHFDAIVLDPPAFAKTKRAAEGALRGYKELNLRAMRLLAPGGTLVTCSCSHHVSLPDFTGILAAAAADAGRRVQLLESRAAAPDHPEILTLPETRYLKCLICRVD